MPDTQGDKKVYRSLQEFDRDFFPASSDKKGQPAQDLPKRPARLVRLETGRVQEQPPAQTKLDT